ncbi:hypothetical protein [Actinoplanes sp. DH11]|uniref:hypothetical protein n=1 Tax=Actinoplanes sp. DH11 TaxID=2857011 RepID=UPI001E52CE09|nr:hypothetical protein [Actinoplanes sp. DH11]
MTQLEELKDAMHSPPDFEPAPLDLAHVMSAGGRLRRRRRIAVGGASALTVAALLIGGSQLPGLGRPAGEVPAAGLSGAGQSAAPTPVPPTGNPSARVPSPDNSSAPGILGTIVETGKRAGGRQWVIYVETIDPDDLDNNLTLVLGHTKTGTIDDFRIEIVGSDAGAGRMTPGFHAVEAGRVVGGRTTPTFGYYVGNAAKITARDTDTGAVVRAHRTAWEGFGKADKMQIFWFDFAQGKAPANLTDFTAYDSKGVELPAGS